MNITLPAHVERLVMTIVAMFVVLVLASVANAYSDGSYNLIETSSSWDGADADRTKATSIDYNFVYGDEESLTFTLPWSFSFYGQSYSQITVDTNGNIWFTATNSANSFSLPATGRGPVSAAWNDDLSSLYDGGVFVQHKSNPDRVVIEWQAETYTDEGSILLNNFEAVLFPDGKVRIDYKDFPAAYVKDFGSGISKDDGTHYLSLTSTYGNAFSLAGRSFLFSDVSQGASNRLDVIFSGSGQGTVTSTPDGIACNTNCYSSFPTGTQVSLHPEQSPYSLFTGWTNGVCSGTVDCLLTLNADTSVTAVFDYDAAHQVQVSGNPSGYYTSIQAAYNAVADNTTIKLWATDYNESLTCNRPVLVILEGGYDSGYTTIVGNIVMNSPLTISNGKITARGLVIR